MHLCIVSPVARVGSVMQVGVGTLGSLGWPRVIHSDGPASGNFGMVPNVGVGVEAGDVTDVQFGLVCWLLFIVQQPCSPRCVCLHGVTVLIVIPRLGKHYQTLCWSILVLGK